MTPKQIKILAFIKIYIEANEMSPTRQVIADYCKYKSRQAVDAHINALVKKGYLKINKRLWRRNLSLTPLADTYFSKK